MKTQNMYGLFISFFIWAPISHFHLIEWTLFHTQKKLLLICIKDIHLQFVYFISEYKNS